MKFDITLSPKFLESMNYLSKNLLALTGSNRPVPQVDSMGEEITEIKTLATVMDVDQKVAAAYALTTDNRELKAQAIEVLSPGIYNAFEDAYEAISHYAYDISSKSVVDLESKRIRMVRTAYGVRRFKQKLGTIIVGDGQRPLDAIQVVHNDVPGYDKIQDKKGRVFYVGKEGNNWVVRSAQTKAILFQTNKSSGKSDALEWLNEAVGGSKVIQGANAKKKSIDEEVETKVQRTSMAVERLGKQGHAFRNSNGDYSYPVANVADLKNAIQAFGRAADADKDKLKAYIKRRAKALGHTELIPDNWKSGEPADLEAKYDTSPLDRSPKKNWVEISGQLPNYIRAVAHALIRDHGFTISRAIATAVNRMKRWSVDPKVSAKTRAKAAAAVAEWEKLKATNKARVAAKKKG